MVILPAICDSCGTVFPSGYAGGGGSTMIMQGCISGPCPNCKGMGHVPDGTYRLVENIIEVLSAPQRTFEELKQFSDLLDRARKEEITTEELKKETKEKAPDLHPLLDWVLPRNRAEKFNFGMVILGAALSVFLPALVDNEPPEEIKPEVIINNVYEINEYNVNTNDVSNVNQPIIVEKIGRNELCMCGSGHKYKKCHGK